MQRYGYIYHISLIHSIGIRNYESLKMGDINGLTFKVVVEEDLEDEGYIVHCPAFKGCWSQGDTIEEALENIKEAIVG